MTTKTRDPVIVVLQLSGGNDYLNTVVPHADPLYKDYRPIVNVADEDVLRLDDRVGFHPSMGQIQKMYQDGNVAILHGVGYENSPRSHFRSMDIWHTCEPETLGTEGWLARIVRDLDPNKDNVVTAVSMGPSLFRALVGPGVPVATVEDINSYGMLTGLTPEEKLSRVLTRYRRMYSPAIGSGKVMDYLGQTGLDALKGADILAAAPANYSSEVEYADSSVGKKLKGIAQIHLAGLGSRVFYLDHSGFDTHADQISTHARLWSEVSTAIRDFFDDLEAHNAAENVVMFLFSEFGRRVYDNGAGTDHGAGGVCLAIGKGVKGGQYGEYPSTKASDLDQGDLVPGTDFRSVYTTLVEDWMGLDPISVVGGNFEKPEFIAR
ncbi:MAG TPA: DUF1501 domain-containing protein [Dehalococcoidia bacterium]|nr:DUF1501 domain-containing protein [Dehalococcoidia bacterium]HIK89053.1 DUF1501 domain-containing protein [Dehalococcoidia bacterium]